MSQKQACLHVLMRCLQPVTRAKAHERASSTHLPCIALLFAGCNVARQRTVRSLLLPMSMMVMLGLACCRASSSQLARWLKVSRLAPSAQL